MCAGVWSSCFSLNVSCLESNLGLSAPELAPNSSFLLPKTVSELWIPSTARGCHLCHPFLRPPPSPVCVLSSKKAPFDLEINFQINSGTQGACRAACTPEQGVVWWHQLRINPKFRHIPERQQHQMRQVFVGLNSFVEI